MTLTDAMLKCKVRGYIARISKPDECYWKNTYDFEKLCYILKFDDRMADDWQCYDPEGEETSIIG